MNNEITESSLPLRRVGAAEGAVHTVAFAGAIVLLARAFDGAASFAVPPAAGVFWLGWYAALRAARVRDWFGSWDAVSFGFVAAYAVAGALCTQVVLMRWV